MAVSMPYDLAYVGRQLNERARKAAEEFGIEVANMFAQAGVNGVNSGRTYLRVSAAGTAIIEREVNAAIQFAYNYTGEHAGEVFDQVSYCAKQMVDKIMGVARSRNTPVGGEIINKMEVALRERKDIILDNFNHGMMGSERLKKDPLLNVINNQTNSPGAILQVGVGDNFSQLAFTQNHHELVNAIDRALASAEFSQLSQEQKDAFSDTAVVVKEEAAKPTPDVGKLKRWGTRLVDLSKDIGMKVVAGEIVHLLNSMFGG
jgi:hypothetical protein